jgi:hypothetical protein
MRVFFYLLNRKTCKRGLELACAKVVLLKVCKSVFLGSIAS